MLTKKIPTKSDASFDTVSSEASAAGRRKTIPHSESGDVFRRLGRQIRRWLERVGFLLERAERHIVDSYRTPPGG